MLCPKCGKEYEGSECPYCSGPKILVNDTDYQKRKMAYEKKQARAKSASSDNQKNTDELDPTQIVKSIKKGSESGLQYVSRKAEQLQLGKKQKSKSANKKNPRARKSTGRKQNVAAMDQGDIQKIPYTTRRAKRSELPYSGGNRLAYWIAKHKKSSIALLVVAIAIILSAVGIYQLVIRKNYVLYMSSNGKIYNVAGLESEYVSDVSDVIFAVDGYTFYNASYPDEIDQSEVTSSLASDNGKYFSCVTYDEDSELYSIYIWNSSECTKISENSREKTLKYVTDKGKVFFTDNTVVKAKENNSDTYEINDAGAVTSVQFYMYDFSSSKSSDSTGTLTLIAEDMKAVNLYSSKNLLIYVDSNNQLIVYDYKEKSKTTVDISVKSIYCLSSDLPDVYTNKADLVNTTSNLDTLFYSTDSGCYYYDISDNTSIYICKNTTTDTQFICQNDTQIYMIQSGTLSYATISNSTLSDFNEIDSLGSNSNFTTLEENNTILYVNSEGQLNSVTKGVTKTIVEQVTDGSLASVTNTQEAFTYWKDGVQYYQKSVSRKAIEMTAATDDTSSDTDSTAQKNQKQVIYYKNKLYFYDSNGKLRTCSTKGSSDNLIGDVDQFWLGTELK